MVISVSTLTKRAQEQRLYVADFENFPEIAAGDTVASITSIAAAPAGLTLGTQAFTASTATVVISGGTAFVDYLVTFVVRTTAGSTLELVGRLSVEN
jgi:hypothetical protein